MATDRAEQAIAGDVQARLNAELWARGDYVDFYATRELRGAEEVVIERHRDALAGCVLELGSGAGRLTGHLCELAREVHGLELAPAMVAYCRASYPEAHVSQGDLRDLSRFESACFDAVLAPYNVLDVLGDADRRGVLEQIHRVLAPGGLLIMSSHNRGSRLNALASIRSVIGSPRRLRNRLRLRRLQHATAGYELRNDDAHDFTLLHYYIDRDAQASQLAAHGYELLECLDLDGRDVPPGASAEDCAELHYVARAL